MSSASVHFFDPFLAGEDDGCGFEGAGLLLFGPGVAAPSAGNASEKPAVRERWWENAGAVDVENWDVPEVEGDTVTGGRDSVDGTERDRDIDGGAAVPGGGGEGEELALSRSEMSSLAVGLTKTS